MQREEDSAGYCWLWGWKRAMNQRIQQPLETGKGRVMVFPLKSPKEHSHVNMLILAQ